MHKDFFKQFKTIIENDIPSEYKTWKNDFESWLYTLNENELVNEYKKFVNFSKEMEKTYEISKGNNRKSEIVIKNCKKWRISIVPVIILEKILDEKFPIEYNRENVYNYAKVHGIKGTSRYFKKSPASIREQIKKYEMEHGIDTDI